MTARPPIGTTPISPPSRGVDPKIVADIRRASRAANVDFGYMMAQAAQESGFQPDAKASTSSATGLFQFIDSTWLTVVKQHGDKHGLGNLADQISTTDRGKLSVADPTVRQKILDLRNDPTVSAEFAADFAQSNQHDLEHGIGRKANSTDLYLAHFLGAGGATQLIKTIEGNSSAKAADLLPQAAAANRSVFYNAETGEARTVGEIYRQFSAKIGPQVAAYSSGSVASDTSGSTAATDGTAGGATTRPVGLDRPTQLTQPMLEMMNVLMLASLKLLGNVEEDDPSRTGPAHSADTDATRRLRPLPL